MKRRHKFRAQRPGEGGRFTRRPPNHAKSDARRRNAVARVARRKNR